MDELTDTHPEAEAERIAILRRLGPERRGELVFEWSEAIRQTAMQGIRDRHPDYGERRVVLEYARITLEPKLFEAAFGEEMAMLG